MYLDAPGGKLVPLHRFYSAQYKDHFLTTNLEEIGARVDRMSLNGGYLGYNYAGIAAYVYEGCTPLLVKKWNGKHATVCLENGQRKLVTRSQHFKKTRKCPHNRSLLIVEKKNDEFRIQFRDRCVRKSFFGQWVSYGYSTANSRSYKTSVRKLDVTGRGCYGKYTVSNRVFSRNFVHIHKRCIKVLSATYDGKDVTFKFGTWIKNRGSKNVRSYLNMGRYFGGKPKQELKVTMAHDQ